MDQDSLRREDFKQGQLQAAREYKGKIAAAIQSLEQIKQYATDGLVGPHQDFEGKLRACLKAASDALNQLR